MRGARLGDERSRPGGRSEGVSGTVGEVTTGEGVVLLGVGTGAGGVLGGAGAWGELAGGWREGVDDAGATSAKAHAPNAMSTIITKIAFIGEQVEDE